MAKNAGEPKSGEMLGAAAEDGRVSDQPEKFDLRSHSITEEKLRELLRLFPETRTEGEKVDFSRLRLALGETVDGGKERYGLTWPGKADCFKAIQTPSLGTLLPAPDRSVSWTTTENLIVEGDNLEVLKLLQKSYLGKVKMIYIDPPYNTGSDFLYPDDYAESLQTYLEYTGQVDSQGKKFSTNTDTEGRFHSKWLNMMYPRLYLARNLLRDDGAIWVSIDDGEVSRLRAMLDEIFGEENFVASVIWEKKYTRSNDAAYFSANHDYILVYARWKDCFELNLLPRSADQESAYSNPDGHPKGPWKATPLHAKSGNPSVGKFSFTFLNGVKWSPPIGTYPRFAVESLRRMDEGNEVWFGTNGKATPSRKTFLSEAKEGVTPTTLWSHEEVGHTHGANNELKELGLGGLFENPKPTTLVRRMVDLCTGVGEGHVVLDFFAGSGTTAQAVMDANSKDGGGRRFILVQLPEPTPNDSEARRAGFATISSLCEERVRRALKKVRNETGFRTLKLAESNFKVWNSDPPQDATALQRQLTDHISHTLAGRSKDDILVELLLKSGFPPTTSVRDVLVADKRAFVVADGKLLICLDRNLTLEAIRAIADLKPERVVCLDESFAGIDQLKVNAAQTFKTKGITFQTV